MSTGMPQGDNGQYAEQQTQEVPEQQQFSPPQPESPPPEQLAYSAPPPEMGSIREAFKSRGYDTTGFEDDEQFIQTIELGLSQLNDLPQLQQMAQYGQQYLQQASAPQQQQQQYEEPVQEAPPEPVYEEEEVSAWAPPEFDKGWDSLLRVDSRTGTYVPINEHVSPVVAQKANEYRTWLRDQGQRFWNNPYDFMKEGLTDWVADVADSVVEQRMGQQSTNDQVTDFLSQNANRFYMLDQMGNIQYDPNTGQEYLTQEGQALKHYATEARSGGMSDPQRIQEYALGMVERDLYQQGAMQQYYQQQVAQQSQPPQQPAQESFVQGAVQPSYPGYSANRDATVSSAAEAGMAQNENLSFMDMALPELMNMGLVQQTG